MGKRSCDVGILSIQHSLTLTKSRPYGSEIREFQNHLFCHCRGLKSELRQAAQTLKITMLSGPELRTSGALCRVPLD